MRTRWTARPCGPSSSVRASPRRVQAPNPRNATPATRPIHPVGRAEPSACPMVTDTRCTSAVAAVMPAMTGSAR